MIKVSVIMAVYNASTTVKKMVESLLKQTLKEFEIIIVDDGSTDGSGELCDKYAIYDNRIRVIHQSNSGVSAARQKGIDMANGTFVIHADADDYTEPSMLECLYEKALEDNADVVFSDFYSDDTDGKITIIKQEPPFNAYDTLKALLHQLHGSCWNKLVRRERLREFNIKFPEGLNYCEDLLTWIQLFKHSEIKISYVNQAFYHYVASKTSMTRCGTIEMLDNIRKFTRKIAELLPDNDTEILKYKETLPIAPFQYGFQHNLVPNKDTRKEYKRLKKVIWNDAKSKRWKIAYILIGLGLVDFARKLIK